MIMKIWILIKMKVNKHALLFGSSYIGRLYLWVDTQKHFDSLTLIIVICEWVVPVYWLISSNTEARTEDLYLQLDYQKSAYETMLYAVCYILFLLKCTAEHCSVEWLNCQNSSRAYVGEMWLWPWHYSNNNVIIWRKCYHWLQRSLLFWQLLFQFCLISDLKALIVWVHIFDECSSTRHCRIDTLHKILINVHKEYTAWDIKSNLK